VRRDTHSPKIACWGLPAFWVFGLLHRPTTDPMSINVPRRAFAQRIGRQDYGCIVPWG
jgi:hypothetical protein